MSLRGHDFTNTGVFLAILVGSIVGALMSIVTEFYTAMGKRPVNVNYSTIRHGRGDQHHRRSFRRDGINA